MESKLMTGFQHIVSASKTVLKTRAYFLAFLFLVPLVSAFLFLIAVKTTAGNDAVVQAPLFQSIDYLFLVSVASLESLLLVMFFYLLGRSQSQKNYLAAWGHGNLGIVSGVSAFLFGAKVCPMCVAAIFGFLGPGAVLFAVRYRLWIFMASAIVLLLSIYSVSRKITGVCEKCG